MQSYLGLDLSLTGTGVAIIDSNYTITNISKLETAAFGAERLSNLAKQLRSILSVQNNIKLACIEGPSYLSEKGHLFEIGEWTGCVKCILFDLGIKYIVATPQQNKKYVLGKAPKEGSKKELIILDIYKKFGEEIRENNMADAYVLSRIAHDLDIDAKDLPPYQQEVIKAIRQSKRKENIGVLLT